MLIHHFACIFMYCAPFHSPDGDGVANTKFERKKYNGKFNYDNNLRAKIIYTIKSYKI